MGCPLLGCCQSDAGIHRQAEYLRAFGSVSRTRAPNEIITAKKSYYHEIGPIVPNTDWGCFEGGPPYCTTTFSFGRHFSRQSDRAVSTMGLERKLLKPFCKNISMAPLTAFAVSATIGTSAA